jgi:hypothetical protein
MDTLHEEAIVDANELGTIDAQWNSIGNPNEVQLNLEKMVVTQLVLTGM